MQRKFNLVEAGRYLGGDTSPIPPRRMRQLAKLITHVRISKREWVFAQSDLDEFLTRHRFIAKSVFGPNPAKAAK
jgi:hypothetical protein